MDRPFEPTGLTTEKWKLIPPQEVRLDELVLVQEGVYIHGLINIINDGPSYCGDTYPHVVIYKGKKYLSDGHHRYCVALIRGEHTMIVRVYNKDMGIVQR